MTCELTPIFDAREVSLVFAWNGQLVVHFAKLWSAAVVVCGEG